MMRLETGRIKLAEGRGRPAITTAATAAIIVVLVARGSTAVRPGWFDFRDLCFYQADARIQSRTAVRGRWHMMLQWNGTTRPRRSIDPSSRFRDCCLIRCPASNPNPSPTLTRNYLNVAVIFASPQGPSASYSL